MGSSTSIIKHEDNVGILLKFANGITAISEANWLSPVKERSLKIDPKCLKIDPKCLNLDAKTQIRKIDCKTQIQKTNSHLQTESMSLVRLH